ncbi:MAG TPA: LacI family DNA-binding transcriptional regulator [Rhodanobacteraceae bacterium]|nr:LacI family DNA-binding transcriptional regulator [Rhodanobacteraceae bacterium]
MAARGPACVHYKKQVTSFDIAELAGVSQATVSRALRGSPDVSDETRQRVMAAAESLHYTVDKNASNLRSKLAGTLALLFFEDPTPDDSHINPFFFSMLGSITRACARQGYDLLISFQEIGRDWHADFAESKKADGIILLGYGDYLTHTSRLEKLNRQGTRIVSWGAVMPDQPCVTIGCDNYNGGLSVTNHLIEQGCKRIAFLGDASQHFPEFQERYRGHLQALRAHGIEPADELQVDAESSQHSGQQAVDSLLAREVKFDAIFAASDLMAIGAMAALTAHGIDVPFEVAVAGFDDIPMANFVNPPLTTVRQDTRKAGDMLVDSLLRLIHNEPVSSRMLPMQLIVRRSSLLRDVAAGSGHPED